MTPDEALAIVAIKAAGRTRYEGSEPRVDEVLAAEVWRLRKAAPSADRLAAMERIMHFFAASLAAREVAEGPVADDQPIWMGYEFRITADLIRRATGEKA